MNGLENKRFIIAGSATGIGRATAERLAAEGSRLFLGDINEAGVKKAVEELRAKGCEVDCGWFDLEKPETIGALIGKAVSFLGGLDGMTNVAAALSPDVIGKDGPLLDMEFEVWRRTLMANVAGTASLCREALPHLIDAGGGSIVNVSSSAAWAGEDERPAYAASKAGINAVTRHIAKAYGNANVRANAIAPGFVATETAKGEGFQNVVEAVKATQALERTGEPSDEAAGIAYLLSDDAVFVTGQVWAINGGAGFRE